MKDPQKDGVKVGKGFPLPWLRRVDELLSLEEDLRRHALVMFAFNLNWFFAIDPGWTQKQIISVLDEEGNDQSAIWAGFFWASTTPNLATLPGAQASIAETHNTPIYDPTSSYRSFGGSASSRLGKYG